MAAKLPPLLFLLSVLPLAASSLRFTSPVCGASLSGHAALAVAAVPAGTAQVIFSMGSHRLGISAAGRSSVDWNTAEAMDGDSAIQAEAVGSSGQKLASAECLITVSNRQASVHIDSPDLGQPLSGTVAISVTGADALAFPAVWTLNIDGEGQSTVWTDNTWKSPLTVTFQLDTTRFANGPHELHISMDSRSGPENPQWVNWRGMANRVVRFENGRVAMDIVPRLQNIYLAPGGQAVAGCVQLYTDGSSGACASPSFAAEHTDVAIADAAGTVTAGASGFTRITVTEGSRTATANVWVASDQRVPHFGGDGEMLRGYQAGKSLFVIAPFFLDPDVLKGNAPLTEAVRKSGVNTLGHGIYINPRSTTASYADWQNSFDQTVTPKMTWAADNGFHLLLTGDDIFRRIAEDAWYTLNWPEGEQAVQYAVGKFAATGVGIGIEAIDEASSLWGARPSPSGTIGSAPYVFDRVACTGGVCQVHWPDSGLAEGTPFALTGSVTAGLNTAPGAWFHAQHVTEDGFQFLAPGGVKGTFSAASDPNLQYEWFASPPCADGHACRPVVPNNALETMRGWMQEGASNVHMAFPPLAIAPVDVQTAWMGPGSVSDYASNYFSSLKTRTTYPWSEGIQEMVSSMEKMFFDRQSTLMLDRPQLMLVSLAGPSYTKQSPGSATYQAGTDTLDQPGVGPDHVSALTMTAAALGGAGLRFYYFEPPSNLATRAAAPLGTAFQTGANPSNLQVDSWQAMGYAANLLTTTLQPFVLGTAGNSPGLGRNIVTTYRVSGQGEMLMVVNGNDWRRTVKIDLRPYLTDRTVTLYRLRADGVTMPSVKGAGSTATVTMEAGETLCYVFHRAADEFAIGLLGESR